MAQKLIVRLKIQQPSTFNREWGKKGKKNQTLDRLMITQCGNFLYVEIHSGTTYQLWMDMILQCLTFLWCSTSLIHTHSPCAYAPFDLIRVSLETLVCFFSKIQGIPLRRIPECSFGLEHSGIPTKCKERGIPEFSKVIWDLSYGWKSWMSDKKKHEICKWHHVPKTPTSRMDANIHNQTF